MSDSKRGKHLPFDRFQVSGGGFFLVVVSLGRVHSPTDLDQGSTLLVTTTLKFVETARLDGKLSVKAMNALQGPCFAFQSDAFVAASAELHLTNCRNIVEMPDEGEIPDEANGGAMNVGGSLTVMGTLIIHDCSTEGYGGSLGSNMVTCLQELMMDGPKRLICGFVMVLQNRLLGGQAGPRIFVAFGCGDFCLPRCDCGEAGFFPLQRKHLHHQFFGSAKWRCPAPELFWGRDNLAVACGGSTGSHKRSFERFCVDISGRVLLASWTLCSMSCVFDS